MNWLTHNPSRHFGPGDNGGDVKLSWIAHTNKRNNKMYKTLTISVRDTVAAATGWKLGSRVVFSIDLDTRMRMKLELDKENLGWLIAKHRTQHNMFKIQVAWIWEMPKQRGIRAVKYEKIPGGLILYIDDKII